MTKEQREEFIEALRLMFENTGMTINYHDNKVGNTATSVKVEFGLKSKFFRGQVSAELDELEELNKIIASLANIHFGFTPAKINWNNTRDIMFFYKK